MILRQEVRVTLYGFTDEKQLKLGTSARNVIIHQLKRAE